MRQLSYNIANYIHPIVTTSWALNYLPAERRRTFVDTMDAVGRETEVSWVIAESPAQTPELPHPTDLVGEETHRTALTLVTWRGGGEINLGTEKLGLTISGMT